MESSCITTDTKYAVMAINTKKVQVNVTVVTIFLTIQAHKSAAMVPFNHGQTIDIGVVAALHTITIQVSAVITITMRF